MSHSLDFHAQPDKLRQLKNRANPQLLDTWVGLVFAGWQWDEEAQVALDRLRVHPFLPATGLSEARLPSSALRDPNASVAAQRAGINLRHVKATPGCTGARATAVWENALPQVHGLLDAEGVVDLTPSEVVRAFPRSVKTRQANSFNHLVDRHWDLCRLAVDPVMGSSLVLKMLEQWPITSSSSKLACASASEHRFWTLALKTLAAKGVDWNTPLPHLLTDSRQVKWIPDLSRFWSACFSDRLTQVLPESEIATPLPRRPRM